MAVRKFKVGDIAVINDKISQFEIHQYGLVPGTEVCIIRYSGDSSYEIKSPKDGRIVSVCSRVLDQNNTSSTIEKFNKLIEDAKFKIEKTKQFIAETEAKIEFMKETGSDTFIENEFKAFHTLTIIEQSNMSKIEKAKAIALLIAGK